MNVYPDIIVISSFPLKLYVTDKRSQVLENYGLDFSHNEFAHFSFSFSIIKVQCFKTTMFLMFQNKLKSLNSVCKSRGNKLACRKHGYSHVALQNMHE